MTQKHFWQVLVSLEWLDMPDHAQIKEVLLEVPFPWWLSFLKINTFNDSF